MNVQRARDGNGWIVRWREQGRQPSRNFDRKGDAESFRDDLRRRRQLGPLAVQQATASRYRSVYKCHIVDIIGDVPLRELGVARLRGWQTTLINSGVSV